MASSPHVTAKLKRKLTLPCLSITTSAPSEDKNEKTFECPLCIDVFKKFSQLEWHLQSMHPKRTIIMQLVKERYGISKGDAEVDKKETSGSQHAHDKPLACCTQTAAEKLQPVVVGKEMANEAFKVPKIPLKFRHKATASRQRKNGPCETSCKEVAESSMKHECVPKMSPDEKSSEWDSFLSFCLSGPVSPEPLPGGHS